MVAPRRRPRAAQVRDRQGRKVALTDVRWTHIVEGHPELDVHKRAVLRAIATADRSRPGRFPGSIVLYARNLGPARFLAVVVAYDEGNGTVLTAYPQSNEPKRST